MQNAPKWVNVHVGREGNDFAIDGIPVWQLEWHDTGEKVMLEKRPDDSRLKRFSIYEIHSDDKIIRFAAANVLPSVFSFYLFMVKPDKFEPIKRAMKIRDYLTKKERPRHKDE